MAWTNVNERVRSSRNVVLLGIGHTNAYVLREWEKSRPPDASLTCVSNYPVATYSGMLPDVLAGQYSAEQMEIDLARLSDAAGARLIVADVSGIDLQNRLIVFADRPPQPFDVLSIGVGSVPSFEGVQVLDGTRLLAIKPMQTLLARLGSHLERIARGRRGLSLRLVTIGGGVGGIEVTLCLPPAVTKAAGRDARIEQTLVTGDGRLAADALPGTAERIRRALDRRGVRLMVGRRVVRVDGGDVVLDDGSVVQADVILWTTGASPPHVLAIVDLPKDSRGFLLTTPTLGTTAGAPVFVVGDAGSMEGAAVPKAGVYAVRQGPVLWENIRRTLAGTTLTSYKPQPGFLKLLNTGDGRAIGEWRGFSFEGRWCRWLKDRIDRRFVDKYRRG